MRETKLTCNQFDFITILEVNGRKAVNEHATLSVKGHIAKDSDEYVLRSFAGQGVEFTASSADGSKKIFGGIVSGIDIHNENEMRTLTLSVVSRSALMDLTPETRTFQDLNMTYKAVTGRIEEKNKDFAFLWPQNGDKPIGSMMVQYKETDWNYAIRLAGRLKTVVVADYLLDNPYVAIGLPNRSAKSGIEAISYTLKKDLAQFRQAENDGGFSERDAIYYTVKSREILELCDPVPFCGLSTYVYAIETKYEGNELIHYYTLKEKDGFFTKALFNKNLVGATLNGKVKEIKDDLVRIDVTGDVKQSERKWFAYATPFSQPEGYGWYFMPEIGDEIRLVFPSDLEHDAYVASAVHVTHGSRKDPETKYIRTVYGQVIQFDKKKILIDDGAGSSVTMHKDQGITMDTGKEVNVNAETDIIMSAKGKVKISGKNGVIIQKGGSVVSVKDAIDISSEHTRVQ